MTLYYIVHFYSGGKLGYSAHNQPDDHFNVYSDTLANYTDLTLTIL